ADVPGPPCRLVVDHMRDDVEMLHGAVWHQESMLEIPVLALTRGAIDELLHALAVLGMDSGDDKFQRGVRVSIQAEDPVRFLRPHDLAARRLPPEATRCAEPLRLRQIGLRAP